VVKIDILLKLTSSVHICRFSSNRTMVFQLLLWSEQTTTKNPVTSLPWTLEEAISTHLLQYHPRCQTTFSRKSNRQHELILRQIHCCLVEKFLRIHPLLIQRILKVHSTIKNRIGLTRWRASFHRMPTRWIRSWCVRVPVTTAAKKMTFNRLCYCKITTCSKKQKLENNLIVQRLRLLSNKHETERVIFPEETVYFAGMRCSMLV